jgi:hypothetical protein
MIESVARELMWAIVPDDTVFNVPASQVMLDAKRLPVFRRVDIFLSVERMRRGPQDEVRAWVIGFPQNGGSNIVLACPAFNMWTGPSWVGKVLQLWETFRADYIVPLEDPLALALNLATSTTKICSLRVYIGYLESFRLGRPSGGA